MGIIFSSFVTVLRLFSENAVLAEIIPTKIIELVYYSFFVLLIISNTIAHVGNVYTAQNMNLLLSTPLSKTRLFFAKLIESTIETSIMFLIFASPVAFAFLYTLDISPLFYLAAIAVSVPFVFTASAIGFLFATVFVRFASSFWKRGAFLLLSVALVFSLVIVRLIGTLSRVNSEGSGQEAIVKLVGIFDNPNPLWLPSRWSSSLVLYFVTGQHRDPSLQITLLIGSAFGTVALAYLVFDIFLIPVKSRASSQHRSKKGSNLRANSHAQQTDPIRRGLEYIYSRLPMDSQTRAVILKDLTSLVRDRAQSLQLLLYLGVAMIYLVITEFMSSALNMAPVARQAWLGFLACVNVIFAGFIVTAVMTRLVFPSISLEGKAFWIINSAPITFRKLLAAKFWCWFPLTCSVAVSLMLAGAAAIYPSIELLLVNAFIGLCISIGCTGLALGVGSIFASFEWESPNQISTGLGTLVLLLCSTALVLITCIPASILAFLTVVPAARAKLGENIWPGLMSISALLVFVFNFFAAHYACNKGAQSLIKLGKSD